MTPWNLNFFAISSWILFCKALGKIHTNLYVNHYVFIIDLYDNNECIYVIKELFEISYNLKEDRLWNINCLAEAFRNYFVVNANFTVVKLALIMKQYFEKLLLNSLYFVTYLLLHHGEFINFLIICLAILSKFIR